MKLRTLTKNLWLLIIIVTVIRLALYIYATRFFFLIPFDPRYISNIYSKSQYVVGSGSQGIGDDGVYAFAGHYYLFENGDVTNVNFEHPPLGKYLIGLSILLFKNENFINIFYFSGVLIVTFLISQLVTKNKLISSLSVFTVSVNSMFLDHLIRSFLDLPFTLFLLLSIYFFMKTFNDHKFIYLSTLFLSFAFATKFFPAVIFILAVYIALLYFYKKDYLIYFIISLSLIPFIYLLTHISYFLNHHTLVDFIKHKKWMVAWWSGSPIIIGNIWKNIFTGKYIDSVGNIRLTEGWNYLIPIVTVLGIFRLRKNIWKNKNLVLIYGVTFVYLVIFLTFLNGGILKFIMPIYPLLVILAFDNINSFAKRLFKN